MSLHSLDVTSFRSHGVPDHHRAGAIRSWRLAARHWIPGLMLVLLQGAALAEERWREAIIAGDYFGAGKAPEPSESVEGDAFLAGGEVILRVPVDGDAAVSGGRVSVSGRIGADLYAAGGQLSIEGPVLRNARLAGGRVHLTDRSDIAGRMTVAGRDVVADGAVGGQAAIAGQSVTLNGRFASGVVVVAKSLTIGPAARIQGRLTYRTASEPIVSPSAEIVGGMKKSDVELSAPDISPWARAAAWIGLLVFSVGVFLGGVLMILIAPRASAAVSRTINLRPVRSMVVGMVLAIGVPVLALLFMLTVVGVPVGLTLFFSWPVLLLLGYLAGVMFMSDSLANLFVRSDNGSPGAGLRIVLLASVLIGLLLLGLLPIVGWVIGVLLLWLGAGAIAVTIFNRSRYGDELAH